MMKAIVNYFKGVKSELKKVKWPTRQQTYRYTIIVVVGSLAVAIFLGGMDFLFTYLLNTFII